MESARNETNNTIQTQAWGVQKRPVALGVAIALLSAWTAWLAYLAFGLVFRN